MPPIPKIRSRPYLNDHMNFSELIRLSNYLEELTSQDLQQATQQRIDHIMYQSSIPVTGLDTVFQENIADRARTLIESFGNFEQELTVLKQQVDKAIEGLRGAWFQQSSVAYQRQMMNQWTLAEDSLHMHRNKPTRIEESVRNMLKLRVGRYCNWKHPAMVIHPMLEDFLPIMVGSDPLYLVDENRVLLEPTMAEFSPEYRQRLRTYQIEETFDRDILGALPDAQFGFCFVFNYLNYRPFELIKKYLNELYNKLVPGGVMIITFNDCDRFDAIGNVEKKFTYYTPGSLITSWAEYVGFEEIYKTSAGSADVWLELKKPGTLESLRGGQCLAKIIPK